MISHIGAVFANRLCFAQYDQSADNPGEVRQSTPVLSYLTQRASASEESLSSSNERSHSMRHINLRMQRTQSRFQIYPNLISGKT